MLNVSLVLTKSAVLRLNFCAKIPPPRQAAKTLEANPFGAEFKMRYQ